MDNMALNFNKPPLYNSYGRYLQNKFGQRVQKVSVNAGFTCPNRDGSVAKGGCTYCNIQSFTPENAQPRYSVNDQIETGIACVRKKCKAEKFIIYFQPYSNTYAPLEHLEILFNNAIEHPDVVGLSIGTRPDCLENEKLELLAALSEKVDISLEIGIESVYDETLKLINRGHNFECTRDAIRRAKEYGLSITVHTILGFPNETIEQMLASTEIINALGINILKIHNLHIVRHTALARQFQEQPFSIFSYDEWRDLVIAYLERLSSDIVIERLHGETPQALLIAPQWHLSRAEIIYGIEKEMNKLDTYQGRLKDTAVQFSYEIE